MKHFLISFLLIILASPFLSAKQLEAHRGVVKNGYNFWLYTPTSVATFVAEEPSDSIEEQVQAPAKPLIVFLHGASVCGTNLERVRRYGTIDAIEKGRDLDAFVIAPQNPGGAWNPRKVMNIIDWVRERNSIDSLRIYVIGMSLGGYGTIDMVATYPDKIAAAMAFCGGGSVADLSGLNDVPLWIVHGTADRAVGIGQSDRVVSAMKATGDANRLIYNRVLGMNHGGPARLFYLRESYDWLLSHSLSDDNREVATNSIIAENLIRNAYKGLNTKKGNQHYVKKKSHRRHRKSRRR